MPRHPLHAFMPLLLALALPLVAGHGVDPVAHATDPVVSAAAATIAASSNLVVSQNPSVPHE